MVRDLIPWLAVVMYLVPIIGTLAAMRRRAKAVWSVGDSLRRLLPEDRFYRWVKSVETRYRGWRDRHRIGSIVDLDRLNLFAGKAEYAFGHLRDYTVGVYMMAAFGVDLTLMLFGSHETRAHRFLSMFYHGTFALLSIWTYKRHVAAGLQMTEFMRVNPLVHPQEFFEHYYRRIGPSNVPVPTRAARTVNPTDISYHTGKPSRQSHWLLMKGFYDTAIFARSAYKALETIGREYGREVFDVMASLWGSRMLQIFQARMAVEGVEKFHNLSGKIVLVFNHKSHLDFVFNFFGLSSTHLAGGRRIRPRYMAAKDHFVDNKYVYSGLGIGKLIEANDMVFVDRKGKGKDAVLDACRKLVDKDIEIAMYPQGTRAVGNYGPEGERRDAGFYTTGTAKSLKENLGHLKKGCAFLAIDTLMAGRESGRNYPVHLVFIGIDGTANLVPKGSFKVQTEQTVKFTVGDILTLMPDEADGLEKPAGALAETPEQQKYLDLVDRLQNGINDGLVKALNLHEKLKSRFLREVREDGLIPKDQILIAGHKLQQTPDAYLVLDRIYALPWEEQVVFLKELGRQLIAGEDLSLLKNTVTDRLFRHRGKELKAIAQQEKAKKAS
ncbi:MAG TPA: lysophospholipid acyltransferase family protein [bacterium]|nr:lysophospholipid acyltransferase family protein [bacterium]